MLEGLGSGGWRGGLGDFVSIEVSNSPSFPISLF